jgi:mannose-6-phosphate isomerase-like protein (cupin superfamily)
VQFLLRCGAPSYCSGVARRGQEIDHPVTGERVVFLDTAADSNGELVRMDMFVRPGGFVAAEHIHPNQEERFEIVEGTVRLRIGGSERDVGSGASAVVPAGTPHVWWNTGNDELHAIVEVRPALRFESFLERWFELGKAGKTNKKGMPKPLQLVVVMDEYRNEIRGARPPFVLQRILYALVAPIGRAVGYRA